MGSFNVFIIRLIIAGLVAVLIGRIFFHETSIPKTIGLMAVLIGFAYLFEYTKKRDRRDREG